MNVCKLCIIPSNCSVVFFNSETYQNRNWYLASFNSTIFSLMNFFKENLRKPKTAGLKLLHIYFMAHRASLLCQIFQ